MLLLLGYFVLLNMVCHTSGHISGQVASEVIAEGSSGSDKTVEAVDSVYRLAVVSRLVQELLIVMALDPGLASLHDLESETIHSRNADILEHGLLLWDEQHEVD